MTRPGMVDEGVPGGQGIETHQPVDEGLPQSEEQLTPCFTHGITEPHEITERRRAEPTLCSSEARLAAEALALARLNEASSRLWRLRSLHEGLDEMLAATMELLGAHMGNVQILDAQRGVLVIAAQRGFEQDFLDSFREVTAEDDSACGRALRSGERIVIEDVEADVPFAPFLPVARAAGYRAVQSTPLIGRDGTPLGVLSTHFRSVHRPSEQDLGWLDLFARQAANFIERCRFDDALQASERRIRLMADAAPVMIWMSGTDKLCTWFNRPWLDFVGRSMEQELGNGWAENVHPDDYDRCLATYVGAFDARQPFSMEYRLRRHDGAYRWVLDNGIPLRDSSGAFTGYIGSCIDITEHRAAKDRISALVDDLRHRLEVQETLLRYLPVGVFIARDAPCTDIVMNPAGAAMLRTPITANASKTGPDAEGLPFRVLKDGVEVASEDLPMQRAARSARPISGEELDVVFPDGSSRTLYEYASPLFDDNGDVRGCLGVFVDITERKRVEERQKLLLDELNHRVKNTLAIIQSIADQTLRGTPEPAAFKAAFSARLSALARAHSLLTKELWQGASLRDIVWSALAPFGDDGRPEAISIDGPPVVIKPNAAVTLSLVLHELATNAAKHGALATPRGQVSVAWSRTAERQGQPPSVELIWEERGGPAVKQPEKQGFGSRLIAASADQLGGEVSLRFRTLGIQARFVFPQPNHEAPG